MDKNNELQPGDLQPKQAIRIALIYLNEVDSDSDPSQVIFNLKEILKAGMEKD